MPYASDRSARLFYDDACGPCRFAARTAQAVSRHRIVATPLAAELADEELGPFTEEERFSSAHLAVGGRLLSGDALTVPLLGLALGPTWERVARAVPTVHRTLVRTYRRLWEYRRTHGCAARSVLRPGAS